MGQIKNIKLHIVTDIKLSVVVSYRLKIWRVKHRNQRRKSTSWQSTSSSSNRLKTLNQGEGLNRPEPVGTTAAATTTTTTTTKTATTAAITTTTTTTTTT